MEVGQCHGGQRPNRILRGVILRHFEACTELVNAVMDTHRSGNPAAANCIKSTEYLPLPRFPLHLPSFFFGILQNGQEMECFREKKTINQNHCSYLVLTRFSLHSDPIVPLWGTCTVYTRPHTFLSISTLGSYPPQFL